MLENTAETTLRKRLNKTREQDRKIFTAYLTLGYPNLETSIDIMVEVANNGVDVIEIGIPFSDPMADGKTIQYTSQYSLDQGIRTSQVWRAVDRIKKETDAGIVIMTYGNVPYQLGHSDFVEKGLSKGVDGVIFPDIPPEHFPEGLNPLNPIFLIAPNTTTDRVRYVANQTGGFVYIVSQLGITGSKYDSDYRLQNTFEVLNAEFPDLPKLQGFGIDSKQAVQNALDNGADGVIVGSALLRAIGDEGDTKQAVEFVEKIREALD